MREDTEFGRAQSRNCEEIREEFRVRKLGFADAQPADFVKAQCVSGPLFFCVWTSLWALFHLVVIALQFYFTDDHPYPKWLSYLTNWGYTLVALHSLWDCACTLYVNLRLKTDPPDFPWYLKTQWVLFNVSTVAALVITVLYYALLTPVSTANSILTHAINSVYAVAGLIVCAKPVRILHVYQPVLFSVIYCIFSLIYQMAGGGLIYEILDWDKMPGTILIALGTAFIMVPTMHMVVFTIYKLRVFVWKSHCRSRQVCNVSGNDDSNQTGSKIAPENTEADRNRKESLTV
uniref:Protein rolling stone-like n=1 Tax=Crassostrea virginica TaxID=6565 RepID=A0A8B8BET7_CRAVI|nr:protein rolling stone-like [Crassostrea virginica]